MNSASRSGVRGVALAKPALGVSHRRGSTAIAAESRPAARESTCARATRRGVREAYARTAAGDIEGALRLFSPDAAYVNPVAALEPGTRRGIDEVASALRSIHEQVDFDQIEVRDIGRDRLPLGDLRVEGRGRISGAPIDQLFYHVLRFAGDRVTAFEWYTGRDEGVGAAGLRT